MGILSSIKGFLDALLKIACIVSCAVMVLLVSYQVLSRFILNDPSAVSEELARNCFVWMGLLASALLYGEKGHMNINFLAEKLGPYKSQYLTIISEVCTLIMAVWIITYGGYKISLNGMGQVNSAMTWLRVGVIYMVIPISGVCICYYAFYNILDSIRGLAAGDKSKKE